MKNFYLKLKDFRNGRNFWMRKKNWWTKCCHQSDLQVSSVFHNFEVIQVPGIWPNRVAIFVHFSSYHGVDRFEVTWQNQRVWTTLFGNFSKDVARRFPVLIFSILLVSRIGVLDGLSFKVTTQFASRYGLTAFWAAVPRFHCKFSDWTTLVHHTFSLNFEALAPVVSDGVQNVP